MAAAQRLSRWVVWPRWASRWAGGRLLERVVQAILAVITLVGLFPTTLGDQVVSYAALGVTAGGIVLSRWWLWPGIVVACAGTVNAGVFHGNVMVVWNLLMFASLWWCLRGARALAVALVAGLANYVTMAMVRPLHWLDPIAFLGFALTVAFATTGSAVLARRQFRAEARLRLVDARLAKEAEIGRRITEERLRIARDLHDMVGHQTAVVNMHLGAAEVHLPPDAAASLKDLEAARVGVQGVIRETQHILEILRVVPGADTLTPNADYSQVPGLIESFRLLGLTIDAQVDPAPAELVPDVGAATYRVVQEALTNAQKHGVGPVSARVEADASRVEITITNRVGTAAATLGGYGLVGMRERVSSAGGTLVTGMTAGQFRVIATMPTNGRTA